MEIREVVAIKEKVMIARDILEDLPDWFGIPESLEEYVEESKEMPFYAAFKESGAIGFIAIKQHNAFSAEVYVVGVDAKYHREGVGKELMACCIKFCKQKEIPFLQVKTLDETNPDKYYAKTRRFYYSMGFKPLEVFPTLWGEANPCLVMIRYIEQAL